MTEIILPPGDITDPTERIHAAIGDLLPSPNQLMYGAEGGQWTRLLPPWQTERAGQLPLLHTHLALLFTADSLRNRLRSINTDHRIVLQTLDESTRLYQEGVVDCEAFLRESATPSMRALHFNVAALLPGSVAYARLLLAQKTSSTPLVTLHQGWSLDVPPRYQYADMTPVPFIAHATGSPE
jgi:hypothetical protein